MPGVVNRAVNRALDLQEFKHFEDLVAWAELLVSVCPPANALELAQSVHACAFEGLYLDANAIAPPPLGRYPSCLAQPTRTAAS
ncbi:MAG: hypothetical protein CM15mP120_17310 [Pseudomonadota bacterium]|nr:MAG: hypothetical protein CM15mP120_17310 [Pseudomonadota bacterium]